MTACSTSSTTSWTGRATGRSTSSGSPAPSSSTGDPTGAPGRRNFTSLVLEPLSADEMRELMAGLVPGLPDAAAERILERAEGIPLYAVETVRMLLADGRLALEGGVARPTGDLDELSVPASLHALIASRLDGLEAGDRTLLQAASVIGKTFGVDAVAAVSGLSPEEVGAHLRGLVRREMLTPGGRSALARARPVRVRPGSRARGRVRDARQEGSPPPAPGRGALLRDARRRGDRGGAGRALRRRLSGTARGSGGRGGRGPGTRRTSCGCGTRTVARLVRPGRPVPGAGARGHDRPGRGADAARRRRRGGAVCRAVRRADRAHCPLARAGAAAGRS